MSKKFKNEKVVSMPIIGRTPADGPLELLKAESGDLGDKVLADKIPPAS